ERPDRSVLEPQHEDPAATVRLTSENDVAAIARPRQAAVRARRLEVPRHLPTRFVRAIHPDGGHARRRDHGDFATIARPCRTPGVTRVAPRPGRLDLAESGQ